MAEAIGAGLAASRRSAAGARVWGGRVVAGFAVLFLLMDGVMKLFEPAPVRETMAQLGYPDGVARTVGILLLACVALYLVPRTAVLGAVLLTGFLGGAVATHLRVGSPVFSHLLFPVYLGAMLWIGLYLRDSRVRALLPVRRPPPNAGRTGAEPR